MKQFEAMCGHISENGQKQNTWVAECVWIFWQPLENGGVWERLAGGVRGGGWKGRSRRKKDGWRVPSFCNHLCIYCTEMPHAPPHYNQSKLVTNLSGWKPRHVSPRSKRVKTKFVTAISKAPCDPALIIPWYSPPLLPPGPLTPATLNFSSCSMN